MSEPKPVGSTASGERAVAAVTITGLFTSGDNSPIGARHVHLDAVLPPHAVDARPDVVFLPRRPSPVFVGRDAALALLDEAAAGHGEEFVGQVVHGLGGVGKSELVLRYAVSRTGRHSPIWWITAESAETITLGLAGLAQALHPAAALAGSLADAAAWATGWLRSHDGWLLVLDNVVEPAPVDPLLAMGRGRIVATSRRSIDWTRRGLKPIRLDLLDRAASIDLVLRRARRTGATERAAANELAEDLGDLPLALEQAAGYIAHRGISIIDYRNGLMAQPARIHRATVEGSATDGAVAQVWSLTTDAVRVEHPLALAVLDVLAYLAPDQVPVDVLTGADGDQAGSDHPDIEDALALLASYNMITWADGVVAVHRLVQAFARASHASSAPPETRPYRKALNLLAAAAPRDSAGNAAGWSRWNALLPHLDALTAHQPAALDQDRTTVRLRSNLLTDAARYRFDRGQLREAIAVLEWLVAEDERVFGPSDSETLSARNNLAYAYTSAGRFEEAISLLEQTLADGERLFGDDVQGNLAFRSNLARAYMEVGRLRDAVALHEQTLADSERTLGPDDPRTLTCRDSLAGAYDAVGEIDKAFPLYERTMADRQRVLGPDHPDTLHSRNNLAHAYTSAGRLDDAVRLQEQNLADTLRVLGPHHPSVLHSRNNLADAYTRMGRLDEAIPLFEQNLADTLRVLGPDHPDILTVRNNVAHVREAAGQLASAVRLYTQNLAESERILGAGHHDTALYRAKLASAYEKAGRFDDAIPLYEQAVAIVERVLGSDHRDTLVYRDRLAGAYRSTEQFDKAICVYRQIFASYERRLGPDHPSTRAASRNLIYAYALAGRFDETIPLLEQIVSSLSREFGPDHPETLSYRTNLAHGLKSAGRLAEAIDRYGQVLADSVRVLGPDHPDTLSLRENLAEAHHSARQV
jgi:tetratricopeptide (TPR) repeat protein